MEQPPYVVLVYSNYSPRCKDFFTMMQQSRLDFSFVNMLCADNETTRKRIKSNTKLQIYVVPCLLQMYPNGTIEKFDGNSAFAWLQNLISENEPSPQEHYEQVPMQVPIQAPVQAPTQVSAQVSAQAPAQVSVQVPAQQRRQKQRVPKNQEQSRPEIGETSVEDIPLEDNDRYKNKEPVKMMRKNDGNMVQDEDLYAGEKVEPSKSKNSKDPHNTLEKAKALAQARESTESEINKPMRKSDIPLDVEDA